MRNTAAHPLYTPMQVILKVWRDGIRLQVRGCIPLDQRVRKGDRSRNQNISFLLALAVIASRDIAIAGENGMCAY